MGNKIIQTEIGRDLCRVRTESGKYRGYIKHILTENLSEKEKAVFVCPRCKGILREVCLSTNGEQFCSCCQKEGEQTHPNIQVNNAILCFKCYCPLISRGCDWLGTLGDCENHLDTCGYVQGCVNQKRGVVLQRNDHVTHEKENCVQRIVKCEHCEKNFKFCELTEHLDVCPKIKVLCELKCGLVMCRDKVAQHLEKECGQVEENCELGCGMKLTRDELRIHVTDNCVQRVVTCEHCEKNFKFCELTEHLDVCPKVEVSCKLKCGLVMCRDKVIEHIDRDCKEKEIECPFAKYKCVRVVKRQYLDTHLKEKETEHWKLKVDAIEDVVMKQSELIKTMYQEIGLLKNLKLSKGLLDPIQFRMDITEILRCDFVPVQREFAEVGFIFQFELFHHDGNLKIDLLLKERMDYGELDLPFRAKFITRLILRDRGITNEFKSELIEKLKEDLPSKFRVAVLRISEVSKPSSYTLVRGHLEMTIIFY